MAAGASSGHPFATNAAPRHGVVWCALPSTGRAINDAGVKQREDIAKFNATVQADLQSKGLAFNRPAPDSFRAKLRESGFYDDWKKRFGNEAWALLEQASGKLA